MLPVISRHLICPIHERLLGRRTFAYLRELEWSQWLSPADLREVQRSKLRSLLRHARQHTRFYEERFAGLDFDAKDDDPLAELSRLPLLSKDEIRHSKDAMIWHDAPGGIFEYHTGGSTGDPLTFHLDRRRQGYDQAARMRTHRWFGVDVGERELYLWGSPLERNEGDSLKRLRDRAFNHRVLDAFDMSPKRMDDYLDAFDRFRPACLFGYPSSIALFVNHARHRGRCLDLSRLRAVFVTGEVFYPDQRKAIENYFQTPVANGYGSREAGFLAHECPLGGMHITSENVIVEIVDDQGSPLPAGQSGEIVVTHLDAYAMPFIRYRTGDIGQLRSGRCACGRGLGLMDVVQGRTTDFLYLPDGTIKHALSIIYPLREMRGVRQFKVTQQADYSVVVEVVADDAIERITRESVACKVQPVLGSNVNLRVNFVDGIAPTKSGKHRYVVSHASPRFHGVTGEANGGV